MILTCTSRGMLVVQTLEAYSSDKTWEFTPSYEFRNIFFCHKITKLVTLTKI